MNWLKKLLCLHRKIFGDTNEEALKKELSDCKLNNNLFKEHFNKTVSTMKEELITAKMAYSVLQGKLEAKRKEDRLEKYLNYKYPKINAYYKGRYIPKFGMVKIDPRVFFTPIDSTIPKINITDYNEIARRSLNWVRHNIEYIDEKKQYGLAEFWSFAFETLKTKKEDCDGGAILLANIMLKSGIPYYRIRINKGLVKGGYHLYVSYCREPDNEFVVLDWCYQYSSRKVENRKLHRDERDYYAVDLSWNSKYIFSKGLKDNIGFDTNG